MSLPPDKNEVSELSAELLISQMLKWGVFLSATTILIGLLRFLYTVTPNQTTYIPKTSLASILNGIFQFNGQSIISAGLFVLILLPITRVLFTVLLFILKRDFLYVFISGFVLIVLLLSLLSGQSIG